MIASMPGVKIPLPSTGFCHMLSCMQHLDAVDQNHSPGYLAFILALLEAKGRSYNLPPPTQEWYSFVS